eukprot:scaffold65824_cov69-Phaeocystis_antarctica.AAC.3
MVDEDYAADCAHLLGCTRPDIGCTRPDMHVVLPRDQSGRHSDAVRARVGESKTSTFGTSPWLDHVTSCCEPPSHPAVAAVTSEIAGGVRPWSMRIMPLAAHTLSAVLDTTCT